MKFDQPFHPGSDTNVSIISNGHNPLGLDALLNEPQPKTIWSILYGPYNMVQYLWNINIVEKLKVYQLNIAFTMGKETDH